MLQSWAGCGQLGSDVPSVPSQMPVLTIGIVVGIGIMVGVSSLCRAGLCGCDVCGSAGKSPACLLPAWQHSEWDALLLPEPCPVTGDALCSCGHGRHVLPPPLLAYLSPYGALQPGCLHHSCPHLVEHLVGCPQGRSLPGKRLCKGLPGSSSFSLPAPSPGGEAGRRLRAGGPVQLLPPARWPQTHSAAARAGSSWNGATAAPAKVHLCNWREQSSCATGHSQVCAVHLHPKALQQAPPVLPKSGERWGDAGTGFRFLP